MDTALWQVRDALVTIFTAAVSPAEVYPGPRSRTGNAKKYVLVGSDGGETGVGETTHDGMTATQEPSDLGPGTWRKETGSVICSAWAWTGNSTFTAAETDARALFDACTAAVAANRSLGGLLVADGLAELSDLGIRQSLAGKVPTVRIAFSVSYGALIT